MYYRIRIREERKPHLTKETLKLDNKVFEFMSSDIGWPLSSKKFPGIVDGEIAMLPRMQDGKYPLKSNVLKYWPSGDLVPV